MLSPDNLIRKEVSDWKVVKIHQNNNSNKAFVFWIYCQSIFELNWECQKFCNNVTLTYETGDRCITFLKRKLNYVILNSSHSSIQTVCINFKSFTKIIKDVHQNVDNTLNFEYLDIILFRHFIVNSFLRIPVVNMSSLRNPRRWLTWNFVTMIKG